MKTYFPIASITFLIFLCFSCHNNKTKRCSGTMQSQKTYTAVCHILDTISNKYNDGYIKLGYIEFPFTLYEDVRFKNIINNPCDYRNHLMTALKDDNNGKVQKFIALYGLQHLCIDDYVDVLKNVFIEYQNGKVDEVFMMASINQGGFSLEVCKNYADEQLQQVLKSILPTLKVERNRKFINDIISGNSWKESREYFKESGEPTPWTCD